MVKLCHLFDFDAEIGERETYNFSFPNKIIISLVRAGDISYMEIEKMSSSKDTQKNFELLTKFARNFDVEIINTAKEFNTLCNKLSKNVDWKFYGKEKDYAKLEGLLKKY